MGLDHVRSEIEHMRGQLLTQRREILSSARRHRSCSGYRVSCHFLSSSGGEERVLITRNARVRVTGRWSCHGAWRTFANPAQQQAFIP